MKKKNKDVKIDEEKVKVAIEKTLVQQIANKKAALAIVNEKIKATLKSSAKISDEERALKLAPLYVQETELSEEINDMMFQHWKKNRADN